MTKSSFLKPPSPQDTSKCAVFGFPAAPDLEVPHSITTLYSLWVLAVSALHQRAKLMHTRDWDDRNAHARTHFPPFLTAQASHKTTTSVTSHQHRSYMLQPMRNRDKSAFPLHKPITRQINRTEREWQHKQIHGDRELVCLQNRCVFFRGKAPHSSLFKAFSTH